MSEDGGSQELIPVFLADQVRRLKEDGSAISPRHSLPHRLGCKGPVDSPRDGSLVRLVVRAKVAGVVRRDNLLSKLPRSDLGTIQSL